MIDKTQASEYLTAVGISLVSPGAPQVDDAEIIRVLGLSLALGIVTIDWENSSAQTLIEIIDDEWPRYLEWRESMKPE